MIDDLLRNQRSEKLSVQPGFGAFLVVLRQVAELSDLFEPFENKLDLPSYPIPFQYRGRGKDFPRKGRKNNDVLGKEQRFGVKFVSLLAGLSPEFFVGKTMSMHMDARFFP